jgi:hypothetical protein
MKVGITTQGATSASNSLKTLGKQMPFALATALNRTANAAQKDIRQNMSSSGMFQFRRKAFIESTIYRDKATDFATKTHPQASVRVHPQRNFLAKHEDGGTKSPSSGRSIAIPSDGVRRNKNEIITKAQRPAALLGKRGYHRDGDVIYKSTGRGKAKRRTALYLLRRAVKLSPRLRFVSTAETTITKEWSSIALKAVQDALDTAR